MSKQPLGFVVYRGPSMLDGSPIVAIVTSIGTNSRNVKTGHMVQTFILADGIEPHAALKTGADVAVCGDCKHRPINGGACYVRVDQAPLSVYRALKRGRYADASHGLETVAQASGVAGYTHQWKAFPAFRALCMASVDSIGEYMTAKAQGWRTFRVRSPNEDRQNLEVICPASAEAGFKTVCASCRACGGHASKAKADIVIMAHGAKASRFNSLAQA